MMYIRGLSGLGIICRVSKRGARGMRGWVGDVVKGGGYEKYIKINLNRRKQPRQKARQIATRKRMLARGVVLADACFLFFLKPFTSLLSTSCLIVGSGGAP